MTCLWKFHGRVFLRRNHGRLEGKMRKGVFKRIRKTKAGSITKPAVKVAAKAVAFAAAMSLMLGTVMTAYGEEGAGSALKSVVTDIFHRHIGSPDTQGGCYTNPIEHVHQGDAINGGGCYTKPVAHVHTGSPETGGGCYGKEIPHTHGPECYRSETHKHESACLSGKCTITYRPKEIIETYTDTCQIHGVTTHERRAAIAEHSACGLGEVDAVIEQCQSCTNSLTRTHMFMNCGKQEGTIQILECSKTIEGYDTSCGYTQGGTQYYERECDGAPDGYGLGCGLNEDTPCGRLILTSQAGSDTSKVIISAKVEDLTGGRLILSSDPYVWRDQEGNVLGSGQSLEVDKNGDYSVSVSLENKDVDESGLHSSILVDSIREKEPETPAPTATATPSATTEPTQSPTATPSATTEPTQSPTATPSATTKPTQSPTATPSATTEPTQSPTATPSATTKPTQSPAATPSATTKPTQSPTATPSATTEPTESPTATPSATITPTESPVATPTATITPTATPEATFSPESVVPEKSPKPSAIPESSPGQEDKKEDTDQKKEEEEDEGKEENKDQDKDEDKSEEVESAGTQDKGSGGGNNKGTGQDTKASDENPSEGDLGEDRSEGEDNSRSFYYGKKDRLAEQPPVEAEKASASPSPETKGKIEKETATVTVSGNNAGQDRQYKVGQQKKKSGFFQSTAVKIITVALSTLLILAGFLFLVFILLCSVRVFNDDGEGRMVYLGRCMVRKKEGEYSLVITQSMTERSCTNRYCIKPGLFRLGKKEDQELVVCRDTKKAAVPLSREMIVIL